MVMAIEIPMERRKFRAIALCIMIERGVGVVVTVRAIMRGGRGNDHQKTLTTPKFKS